MIQRAFRYRLYPTAEQAAKMEQAAGAARFVYNLALEQRRDFWRQARAAGRHLNAKTQGLELKNLRREAEWLAAVSTTVLYYALLDLDKAFDSFWRGGGYPSFRSKARHCAFRQKGRDVRFVDLSPRWALIRAPKIGLIKMRVTRPWRGRIVSAAFVRDTLGWHVSLSCEIEHDAPTTSLGPIGIDRGVANTLALSTGEFLSTPDLTHLECRKKRAQRILSRRKRGSNRRRKQRERLARITAKIARTRSAWQHRVTIGLARRFGIVAVESLNTKAMMAKGRGKNGLNRSIADQGWRSLESKLSYKLKERGGTLVKVSPAYTSQECSACGTIDKRSRESQARFVCRHCGFEGHADTNAAINILRRSVAVVEGRGCAPDEARTLSHAA